MSSTYRRAKFLQQYVKKAIYRAGGYQLWKEIYEEYLSIYRALPDKSDKDRRRKAWRMIFQRRIECQYKKGEAAWKLLHTKQKHSVHNAKVNRIINRLPASKIGVMRVISQERVKMLDSNRLARKHAAKDMSLNNARERLISQTEKKVRAQEELTFKIQQRMEEKIMAKAELKNRIAEEVQEALNAAMNVRVKDNGPADPRRDILWVYENLAKLFKTTETGVQILDAAALKTAPSNGAISVAHYAALDRKAFFEKFVIKILPKATEGDGEVSEEEEGENADPTFGELEKYLKEISGDAK